MIIQETYKNEEGVEIPDLIKTYSDLGLEILQVETGIIYQEAVDKSPVKYTYTEVEKEEEENAD